jgi:hypothetical protein
MVLSHRRDKKYSQRIYEITGQPVWLNVGVTRDLQVYGDEIAGHRCGGDGQS